MAEAPVQPKPTSQGINWKNILIGAVIGAALVGVGLLIFYLYQGSSEETTTTTTKTSTPSAKTATPSAEKDETANWKTYKNEQAQFALDYPPDWVVSARKKLADSDDDGVALKGDQGRVEIAWTAQFGHGGCQSSQDISIKNKTLNFCHAIDSDGNETWRGIFSNSASGTFPIVYGRATAYAPNETNRQLILKIISTLYFY
jgi:hypothetical protein